MTRKHLITAKAGILGSQDEGMFGKACYSVLFLQVWSNKFCDRVSLAAYVHMNQVMTLGSSFPILSHFLRMWSTSFSVVSFLPLLKRWQIWQPSRRRHQLMLSPWQDVAAKPGDGTCAETADDRFPNFCQSAAWLNMFFWGYHSLKGKQMKWGGYQDKRQDKDAKMTRLTTANCHNCR